MQNIRKIKVGIMGSGWAARMRHLPAFRRNPNVEVISIYNPDETLAKKFAADQNIASYFHDQDRFLAEPIDLVSICTPPMYHFQAAKAALLAGKHVLLEKPITMTSAEAQELSDLAKQKNLILCPAHNFLFCRAISKAQKLMSEGKIGEVIGAMGIQWSSHKRPLPSWYPQLPGGLFFDESPHLLYLLDFFLKDIKVEEAWRSHRSFGKEQVLERFEARLEGQKGEGLLSMWFGAPMSEWLIIVCGSKGAFVLDIFRDVLIYMPEERKRSPQYLFEVIARADRQIWSQMFKWVITRFSKGSHLFGLDTLINKLTEAILTGAAPPLRPEDGKKIILLIEDILKISEQKNEQQLS